MESSTRNSSVAGNIERKINPFQANIPFSIPTENKTSGFGNVCGNNFVLPMHFRITHTYLCRITNS